MNLNIGNSIVVIASLNQPVCKLPLDRKHLEKLC